MSSSFYLIQLGFGLNCIRFLTPGGGGTTPPPQGKKRRSGNLKTAK